MLSYDLLRKANKKRLPLFKNKHGEAAHSRPDGSDWDFATWLMATVGELGELAEVRLDYETHQIRNEAYAEKAQSELADVAIYLDIMALRALDIPLQEEDDDDSPPTDAYLIMLIIAALGNVSNNAKKFYRGDLTREEYLAVRKPMLERLIKLISSLMGSYGVKNEMLARAVHPEGIDLGKAIVKKFNEVSDRVDAPVYIDGYDVVDLSKATG